VADRYARANAHIQALLDELGAEWLTHDSSWLEEENSAAIAGNVQDDDQAMWFISLPDEVYAKGRVAYFVALHEIGHLRQHKGARGGWLKRPTIGSTLDREADAWWYALGEAWYRPTKPVWRYIADAVESYMIAALSDGRYKASYSLETLLRTARERS